MANEVKHTPGPWSFSQRGQRVYGGENRSIKIVQLSLDPVEWIGNGQLIAAAPGLLEVLVEQRDMVLHWIEDHEAGLVPTSQSLNAALAKLDAALAGVEGK